MFKAFIIALLVAFGLVVFVHFAGPMMAGVIAVGSALWVFLILSIFAFCGFIMAVFIVPAFIIYVLVLVGLAWLIVAIVALPFLFPILLPLFIVMLFMIYLRRRKHIEPESDTE